MFENFYTTKMDSGKKRLKQRFLAIRQKPQKSAKALSVFAAGAVLLSAICGGVIASNAGNFGEELANLSINGKKDYINVVNLKNKKYLNNDSYYVPLREIFEKLGAEVKWDVETDDTVANVFKRGSKKYTFPYFAYEGLENLATDETMLYIYGGSSRPTSNMPVVEIDFKNGKRFNCQPGCEMYSEIGGKYLFSWAPPVVLIDGKAYIPLRAVANIISKEGEEAVKWNDDAHDTYFEGSLTFDKNENSIVINY